jgi:hypothetical protein
MNKPVTLTGSSSGAIEKRHIGRWEDAVVFTCGHDNDFPCEKITLKPDLKSNHVGFEGAKFKSHTSFCV